ncbi:hypothetical protein BV378_02755 [Nostoc sp. RF31YmG]|nr:hypothetical protein BV378_02755 [Nostoc sp. RF31YmG]
MLVVEFLLVNFNELKRQAKNQDFAAYGSYTNFCLCDYVIRHNLDRNLCVDGFIAGFYSSLIILRFEDCYTSIFPISPIIDNLLGTGLHRKKRSLLHIALKFREFMKNVREFIGGLTPQQFTNSFFIITRAKLYLTS